MRHNKLDPLLDKENVRRCVNNFVAATFAEEQIELISLLEHVKVLKDYASELLEPIYERSIDVVLYDIA